MIDAAERAEVLGKYIVRHSATVRETAGVFGISKSTGYTDVTQRLQHIAPGLCAQVRQVLDVNKAERHIRGGNATRVKYRNRRRNADDAKTGN